MVLVDLALLTLAGAIILFATAGVQLMFGGDEPNVIDDLLNAKRLSGTRGVLSLS
jgi:hypothetical protein